MNGPIRKPKIGLGLGALELWSIGFGLIVVAGVLLESGPEFWQSVRHWKIPSRVAIGGAMVALGVFGEVAIGVFIARSAKREQVESSERISEAVKATADANDRAAQALDRATKAEQATAEANLARVKIEQRMQPRHLDAEGRKALLGLLGKYPKMGIDVVVFEQHIPETHFISNQLLDCFISVGWMCRLWESRRAKYRLPGPSIIFAVASGYEGEFMELASALARALKELGLDAGTSAGLFSAGSAFEPGDFEMVFQHPGVLFHPPTVVAFRLQIGAKEFTAMPLRPVTPPQA